MKRNKIVLILSVLCTYLLFCSFSKNNNKTVKGYIHVYGNEPFTYIGIETEEHKKYAISASDEDTKKLRSSQGNLVEITGIIVPSTGERRPDMLEDGKIEVAAWKIVK